MTTMTTSTYIRKLVKVVYQKEKEIEDLKRVVRGAEPVPIDQNIQIELMSTTQQLRQVSKQMNQMESQMIGLEN